MMRPFFVAVVETVDLGHDDPGGQGQQEEDAFPLEIDSLVEAVRQELGDEEGNGEADKVRGHEHPPNQPASIPAALWIAERGRRSMLTRNLPRASARRA